jgi:hypothetical protein
MLRSCRRATGPGAARRVRAASDRRPVFRSTGKARPVAERRSGGRCSGSRHGEGSEPNSGRVWRTGSTLTWISWSRWSRRSGALGRRSRSQPQGPRRRTRVARSDSRAQAPRSDEFARICPTEWKLVIRLLQRLCRSPVSYEGSSRLRVVAGKRLVTAQIAPSMLHSVGGAGIAGVKNRARVDGREVLQLDELGTVGLLAGLAAAR